MTNGEAINWIINISADIGKAEHSDLWHYEQALSEIREMLETAQSERKTGRWKRRLVDSGFNADWHCSECGWKTALEEHGYNFCPNCGCEMER